MSESPNAALVTGASGFLGRSLVARLRALDRTVVTPERSAGFELMRDELDLSGVDHVYHLAARTFVPDAWKDPVGFHLVNAHGVMRVLEQCRKANCSMTYVSGFVYGNPEKLPISESDPVRPSNPYAFSKFAGEQACRFYAEAFGMNVSIVRPFNIYGPEQGSHFLLPIIVNQVVDPDVREVVVKDLAPRRDYIYIDDVITGILAASASPQAAVFNIGSGHSLSVSEVIDAAFRAAGVSKPVRSTQDVRSNEIMDAVADVTSLKGTGWKPTVTFDQGMRAMVAAARVRLAASHERGA